MKLFNWQNEVEQVLEQLLEGTAVTAGVVIEAQPGQYEVIATDWDEPEQLPAGEVSIVDLIDEYREVRT